jgi:hypothetical protein
MTRRSLFAALAALAVAAPALAAPALIGPAWADDASFTLVNRGSVAVRELFVTPAGDANWGQNRVAGHPIPPAGHFLVKRRADGNCILDIRAVFTDGKNEERKGLNTCNVDSVAVGLPSPAAPATGKEATDPSVRLVNRGQQPIIEFYVAVAGHQDWGANRLEAGPLPAATEKLIRIARTGDCLFDLRVVFADHTAKEKHGTDLCRITDLPVP